MRKNPLHCTDFYKADHRSQYPENTEEVYSNFTPRSNMYGDSPEVLNFGLQYFIKEYLIDVWNKGFFDLPLEVVLKNYKRRMDNALGKDAIKTEHIKALHDIGYLPIKIKALPEGVLVPMRVPILTIKNTKPEFFWLTNYLETLMSNILWKPITSATTAYVYRKEFERHAKLTGSPKDFIDWQGHDFSARGMSGVEDMCMSGAGHLLSFNGTDSIHAIDFLEEFYNANCEKELIGGSVMATEHATICSSVFNNITQKFADNIPDSEFLVFRKLITETYPTGIVSIVSDSFDFWKVITEYLPKLKNEILRRGKYESTIDDESFIPFYDNTGEFLYYKGNKINLDEKTMQLAISEKTINYTSGRVVCRPDSGDPVDIICGTDKYDTPVNGELNTFKMSVESIGAYESLWNTFGGTINEKGYKVLNPKIGLIYGDSITIDRQKQILHRLELKKFTASNLVLGIGSFTYQYKTRDTYSFAMKCTNVIVDGTLIPVFKDPKTDSGMKKSAKGLLCIIKNDNNEYELIDNCTPEQEEQGELQAIFEDGKLLIEYSLQEIRDRLTKSLEQ